MIKNVKTFRKNFPENAELKNDLRINFPNPENPKIFRVPRNFPGYPEKVKKFPVFWEVENPGKRETLIMYSLGPTSLLCYGLAYCFLSVAQRHSTPDAKN